MGGCGWKWHTCLFFVISPCGVCIKHEVFNFGGGNISLSVLLKCFLLPSLSANNTLIIICSFRWPDIRQSLVCYISAMCRQIHKVGCFTPLGKRFVCSFVNKLCKVNNLFYISQIIWRLFYYIFVAYFKTSVFLLIKNRDICLSLMVWYITRCVMFRLSFQEVWNKQEAGVRPVT